MRHLRLGARTLQTAMISANSFRQPLRRGLATAVPVPPATQNAHGSKGPTAMVFLNMGGPSTVDEVGDFLSRLFVRWSLRFCPQWPLTFHRPTPI